MYKIHYNNTVIRLSHPAMKPLLDERPKSTIHIYYNGKLKFIPSYLDKVEKAEDLKEMNIYYHDVKQLKRDFFSRCERVEAAGGVVFNSKGQLLMIYRRGNWDLPKGKLDPFETKKEAAVREVQEETGLEEVTLIRKLMTTHHIYRTQNRGKRVIKPSYWYLMATTERDVIPQVEEDIEEVRWVKLENAHKLKPMYASIRLVIERLQASFL